MRSIHADELVKVIEKQLGHGIYENNGDLRANIVYRGYTINFANAEVGSLTSLGQTGINIERSPILIFDPEESDTVNNDFFSVEEAIFHINNVIDNGVNFTNIDHTTYAIHVNDEHVGYLREFRETDIDLIRKSVLMQECVSTRVNDVPKHLVDVSVTKGQLIKVTF